MEQEMLSPEDMEMYMDDITSSPMMDTAATVDPDAIAASAGMFAMMGLGIFAVSLTFTVIVIASLWKIFTKAGKPGWAAIIPIYNVIVLLEIVGKPVWWIILLIVPIANLIVSIIVGIELAKTFGKGTGFGIGLALLSIIFYPILAFGNAQYIGVQDASPQNAA